MQHLSFLGRGNTQEFVAMGLGAHFSYYVENPFKNAQECFFGFTRLFITFPGVKQM